MKRNMKYSEALDQLTWLNACSSGLYLASGISSVATLSVFTSLSVSIPLGAIYLAGASVSGVVIVLTKKYQKKLTKVTKLTDIIASALAMFKTSVSKAVKDDKIDKWEFYMLRALYYNSFNNLSNIDHKMEAENRNEI